MPRCPECHRRLPAGAACPRDGAAAPLERALEVGPPPPVPGFRLGDLLGAGGAGAVWAALGEEGRAAAIKVARAAGPNWQFRFAHEADALAAIGPPHTPELLARGTLADGRPWIAMERLEGETVADLLAARDEPLPVDLACALADAALAAVEAAHRRDRVHRDLKPENLFVRAGVSSRDPCVAVVDFGLAGADRFAREGSGRAFGTLGYMAPEVLAGGAGDARADVYALGVVLYELFTLRAPFAGEPATLERAHLAMRPPAPGQFAPVPAAVEELILACLAKLPERRPADGRELRRRFRAAVRATPPEEIRPAAAPAEIAVSPGGEELAALLWLDVDAGPARLAGELARTPGVLVRQRGRTCLVLFAAARCERPAAAALSAATRLLGAWGGCAALHVARVHLRPRDGRPPAAHGHAIDRPADWLPAEAWTGAIFTRAFVEAFGDLAAVPASQPEFFAPAGALAAPLPPLVGRGPVLDALATSARWSFESGRPGLVVLVGGPGSGKSRLLAEAGAAVARLGVSGLRLDVAADRLLLERLDGAALRERARFGPLAVLVDGAHLADDAVLDALEYATLGGPGLRLWVLVTADGRALDAIRPRFGRLAERSERIELEPLTDAAMRELAAWLLVPADYVPAAVLDRLALLAGGNPGMLSELVRALKREGAVRPRADRRSHQVSIAAIERVPATAAGRWEASRALDPLPPELAASARVAAALGPVIDEAELDSVEDALERQGAGRFFDARVALRALATRDLMVERDGDTWAFTSPLVQEAIYQAMDASQRARIHRHALNHWLGRSGPRALVAIAHHGGLAGAHADAQEAALTLAAAAAEAHRDLEAERWYSVALLHIRDQPTRIRALVGRGRARWRLDRAPEALADLTAAESLAADLGHRAAGERAGILLDEAMILDWSGNPAASAARVDEARPLVDGDEPGLAARLLVAAGRTEWRRERVAEALALLEDGEARAQDDETRLIALLLAGCALTRLGRLDDAEATFARAEAMAVARDDRLHLCALHVNRINLWIERGDAERGADELRRAVQLAREIGHPVIERAASHNLAEVLHVEDRDAEALPLALRSFDLQLRFGAVPGPEDALLLCRIALGLGDRDAAARHLAWAESHVTSDQPRIHETFQRAAALVLRGGQPAAWDAVVAAASDMTPVEQLEILYLRAGAELAAGGADAAATTFEAARAFLDRLPSWAARFDRLAERDPTGPPPA